MEGNIGRDYKKIGALLMLMIVAAVQNFWYILPAMLAISISISS
jgi:hypothetical protein